MENLSWEEFEKVDMRVGTIISAVPLPEARKPAYQLQIDFGAEIGVRKSSAQLTKLYNLDQLIGKQIIAVVNFPPKQIGKFMSEVLCLGFPDRNGNVVLLNVDRPALEGGRMY